ncbi:MAG TPA: hypothetical protein VI653_31305 [Steroidobacteraceae bacterium]
MRLLLLSVRGPGDDESGSGFQSPAEFCEFAALALKAHHELAIGAVVVIDQGGELGVARTQGKELTAPPRGRVAGSSLCNPRGTTLMVAKGLQNCWVIAVEGVA